MEALPAYTILNESIKESSSYMDKELLTQESIMIVKANYRRDVENNIITVPFVPIEIYRLAEKAEVMQALEIVDFLNSLSRCLVE